MRSGMWLAASKGGGVHRQRRLAAQPARALQARRLLLSSRLAAPPMDAPLRSPSPAQPPPAPRHPPPGPPPGPDTSDVLQQIMAITDQSLDEAQARCSLRACRGPLKGAGRGGGLGQLGREGDWDEHLGAEEVQTNMGA